MSVCASCNTRSSRYEDTIQCGECQRVYHLNCQKLTLENFDKMRKDGKVAEWSCTQCFEGEFCKDGKNDADVGAKLDQIANFMKSKFKETNKSIQEVVDSQKMISDQYDDIIKKLNVVAELEKKVLKLETILADKEDIIKRLDERLRHQEQYSRKDMIEIREVLEKPNEDVEEVVVKVISQLKIPFSKDDIEIAHRLKAQPGKTKAIIVKLKSRKKKEEIMKNRKEEVTNLMVFNEDKGKIHIHHSLSPYYRNLLIKANIRAKENNYKFCWFNEKVMVRKSETSSVITIRDEKDLDLIKPNVTK